jgi:multiple sugar transport system ATP-binding protein
MASIVLDRIGKVFRHHGKEIHALRDINLQISSGELLAVLGPSGSGKTTLLRLIAGLETLTDGEIAIDGKSMNGMPPHQRDIAMMFQGGALFPHMTAYQNMAFGLKLRKLPATEIDHRIKEAADFLGLQDCLSRFPPQLSTGQRQRVALGRAMVRQPPILLLDEPLANLDAPMRAEMRAEITRLQSRIRATMIYVTHDQGEALSLGQRVAVFREGVLEQIAEPQTLYELPANLFVARFVGSPPMNLIPGAIVAAANDSPCFEGTRSESEGRVTRAVHFQIADPHQKDLHAWVGRSVVLGIRPEDIEIIADEALDSFQVTVNSCERTGADLYLHVQAGGHVLIVRAPRQLELSSGCGVSIRIPATAVHFFDPNTGTRLNRS